jgi:hypothetical protein
LQGRSTSERHEGAVEVLNGVIENSLQVMTRAPILRPRDAEIDAIGAARAT